MLDIITVRCRTSLRISLPISFSRSMSRARIMSGVSFLPSFQVMNMPMIATRLFDVRQGLDFLPRKNDQNGRDSLGRTSSPRIGCEQRPTNKVHPQLIIKQFHHSNAEKRKRTHTPSVTKKKNTNRCEFLCNDASKAKTKSKRERENERQFLFFPLRSTGEDSLSEMSTTFLQINAFQESSGGGGEGGCSSYDATSIYFHSTRSRSA